MRYSAAVEHRVTLYSRDPCGLCDAARDAIEEARRRRPFSFEEILIDGDEELEATYGLRVPVVLVDGEEAFEIELTAGQLLDRLGSEV